MLWLLPLAVAVSLLVPLALAPVSRRVRLGLSRIAVPLFGSYVAHESPRRRRQRETMRAAYIGSTHRVYAARALLVAGVAGVSGSVVGVYLAGYVFDRLSVTAESLRAVLPSALGFLADVDRLPSLGPVELFALLLFSGATVGSTLALGTYWGQWAALDQRASVRGSRIEATLPRTIAFVYALSRSGMPFPRVMGTLSRNERVYGEAARELGVAVRDMETFGTDVLTALEEMASNTPSENLEEFAENLASVLGSGRSLSEFLRGQYERYQAEAEAYQQQYLELLSTFAEVYVTVLVAGPLFFVTVLVVVGLVLEDTLWLIRLVTYVGIPLGSAAFVVYLDAVTRGVGTPALQRPAGADDTPERTPAGAGPTGDATVTDGGTADTDRWGLSRERLAAYDRLRYVRRWLERPLETLLRTPGAAFAATVPLGAAWVVASAPRGPLSLGELAAAVDAPLAEATLFVLGVYALVFEVRRRRVRGIEEAVPDFLDRLASVNEAGVTVIRSLRRVADTDLGDLGPEVDRTVRDVNWGADVGAAFVRLDRRASTPMVSRSVALVTNAMAASGDVAPVLRIAANEAQDSRRLRRERRQEMLTYLVVIYISFLVFLGIIAALSVAFIPAVESATASAAEPMNSLPVSGGVFAGLQDVNTEAYARLFFRVAAIQAVCSGLVAGQLGEGDVRAGAKHATVLLALSYVLFLFV